MCVGMFSITAHAETLKDFTINLEYRLQYADNGTTYIRLTKEIDNNSTYYVGHELVSGVPMDYSNELKFTASIVNKDGSLLVKEGEVFDFSISGLLLDVEVSYTSFIWKNTPQEIYVGLVHTDGTWTYLYDVDWVYSSGSLTHAIKVSGTAPKDVRKIVFYEMIKQRTVTGMHGTYSSSIGMGDLDTPTAIEVDIQSKEVGLLENIGNKLSSGFSALGDKLMNVFNSIVELPQKIWNLISDGLKSLFVPSEESMTDYEDKWDSLLSQRLGAVYEVCDIVTDSWSEIGNADTTDTINFPSATIDLPGDAQFTFGGYDVKIVPDGFDVLVQAIKLIVGIVCTLAFINGMLRRYDEIMGVEQ